MSKNKTYINGRNQIYTITDLFNNPSLCHKLNAKLFTQLKRDMKEEFQVFAKPGRYGKGKYWENIFIFLNTKTNIDSFLNNGYPMNIDCEINRYGYAYNLNITS